HLCKHCSLAPVCLPEENRAVSEGSYKAVRLFPEKRERATVHITGYRTRIKKSADTIIVEKFNAENESVVEKIPAHNVESLNLHGNCQVSAQMIRYLARQEINLHWFTGGGEYVGGLQPGGPAVQRRLRQYEALRDPQFRMNLARRLIQAKCESQLKYILRSTRKNQKLRGDIDRSIEIMRTLLKKIEAAESSGTLLGIEGSFARRYHGIVPRLLNTEIESCLLPQGRSKRPPRDPYNACLSFLYALLYRSVRQAIIAVGLDPCFGFFHTARSAAEPLVLDMIELFRVTLCDMPLIGSMNRLFWKEADFMITKSKVWLNEDGRKKAIQIFESRLDDHWKHPVIGYSLSYYRMIELEVRLLEKEWGDNVQTFAKARLR
ncbi:MAG: type I-MYXAN CRISPR-associated endonuclease Cas1, partial [Leptospiraceae bacterium]|nr:type I-MYXAN CRISPR-associated endonuclease Cas1 [Leptospiraceae bacterium]